MGRIWLNKEEERIFQAEGSMSTKERKEVTCLDNSKFSLAGTYERRPAGTKLEKYVRTRLSC